MAQPTVLRAAPPWQDIHSGTFAMPSTVILAGAQLEALKFSRPSCFSCMSKAPSGLAIWCCPLHDITLCTSEPGCNLH